MQNRVFICSHSMMPRGDANSNYILHMAMSLIHAGWDVFVIGKSVNGKKEEGEFKGIRYVNLEIPQQILPLKILGHFFYGKYIMPELERLDITEEDYMIIYGGYISLFSSIYKNLKSLLRNHIVTCVVEWPTEQQFRFGKCDFDYICWKWVFTRWYPKWKKTIVISQNLQKHFASNGCNTLLLPPLIDCDNVDFKYERRKNNRRCSFVYAGADTKKDAVLNMILSLKQLSEEELQGIEFHITKLTKQYLKELLDTKSYIIDKYKNSLFIHGWLEYDDLMKLYQSMDYLLLAREKNQFTLSNFPSKVPEMLNYGIVPVCSEVGDYTELYLENNVDSIIFEGSSPDDCAKAIRLAMKKTLPERDKMSIQAKRKAETIFDYRNWSKRVSDFIIDV